MTIKNIHIRVENRQKGYSFGFTLDQVNVNTINEKGEPEFLDRTLEENKMRDLHKKLLVQDISVYWKAIEDEGNFIGSLPLPDEQKKNFLKSTILRKGQPHKDYDPILSLSLESYLVLRNINNSIPKAYLFFFVLMWFDLGSIITVQAYKLVI
ncbi:MAG: hypothetical protein EOO43_22360 [Flavobacterium sp.]|nr:MAG: hypothetical protein EOO43_22360 [Flavobacterium sp.]